MNLFKSMFRIISTPIPMPYRHMLYTVVFIYTFLTPFIEADKAGDWNNLGYSTWDDDSKDDKWAGAAKNDGQAFTQGWVVAIMTCLAFYGLLELSVSLFNPFGHDAIDHDIGSFCGKANTEMMVIAKVSKASKAADLTDYTKVPHSEI